MRIKVISPEEKVKINISIPTVLIKSRLVLNSINKYAGVDIDADIFRKMYKSLRSYIKENGHFNLVEVNSKDGNYIKIRF